jgi:hypothetical protein
MIRLAQPRQRSRRRPHFHNGQVMADEIEFIPLARAASLAHARVFPGQSVREMKTLDVLALVLSTLVPLYQRESEKDAPRALDKAALAEGRFTRGATRLERAGRAPLRFLVVARRDLSSALEALAKDAAAISRISGLTRPPPQQPACSSAPDA